MIPQWGEPSSQILVGCPCMDTTRKAKFPYKHKSTETFPSPTKAIPWWRIRRHKMALGCSG